MMIVTTSGPLSSGHGPGGAEYNTEILIEAEGGRGSAGLVTPTVQVTVTQPSAAQPEA
jgi:hypothetical protein